MFAFFLRQDRVHPKGKRTNKPQTKKPRLKKIHPSFKKKKKREEGVWLSCRAPVLNAEGLLQSLTSAAKVSQVEKCLERPSSLDTAQLL